MVIGGKHHAIAKGTIAFCEREFKARAKTEGHREQGQKRQQNAEGHRVYYLNMLVGQKEVCPGNIKAVLIKLLSQPLSEGRFVETEQSCLQRSTGAGGRGCDSSPGSASQRSGR